MTELHPQLIAVREDLRLAEERLRRLSGALGEEDWLRDAPGGGWSAGACIEHLNLVTEAMLPRLREGIEKARALQQEGRPRLRKGLIGWMLSAGSGPGRGMRIRTATAFDPHRLPTPGEILERWQALLADQLALIEDSHGLPLDRVRMISPVDGRFSYNLYAALCILPAHHLRHIQQAEKAAGRGA